MSKAKAYTTAGSKKATLIGHIKEWKYFWIYLSKYTRKITLTYPVCFESTLMETTGIYASV